MVEGKTRGGVVDGPPGDVEHHYSHALLSLNATRTHGWERASTGPGSTLTDVSDAQNVGSSHAYASK